LLLCSFVILATASASVADSVNATTVEDFERSVEDFERCFVYNRIPKPYFAKVKVWAPDFYGCREKCNMERECLYFQWRNGKCFKYVVEDRRRKKYVYGIAYCDEPGVIADNAPYCMEQEGYPITRTKKYKDVGYPVECAEKCEYRPKKNCILWQWNKEKLTCKITLLKANPKPDNYSSFDRHYCFLKFVTLPSFPTTTTGQPTLSNLT